MGKEIEVSFLKINSIYKGLNMRKKQLIQVEVKVYMMKNCIFFKKYVIFYLNK